MRLWELLLKCTFRIQIRSLIFVIVTLAALFVLGKRVYHGYVPRGASALPFLLASVDGGTIESPSGKVFEVWFNDAGAAHSGAHWTWLVSTDPLYGKRVVTEGYLGPEYAVDQRPIHVAWQGDFPMIKFRKGRYGKAGGLGTR